jgi:hypothetical protein
MDLKSEALTRANAEGFGEPIDWQVIEAPNNTKSTAPKSTAGLPAGNAGTFQLFVDVVARVVRDLGRKIGAGYDL